LVFALIAWICIPLGKSASKDEETKCLGGLKANMVTECPNLSKVLEKV
jgi:hypothetical protein